MFIFISGYLNVHFARAPLSTKDAVILGVVTAVVLILLFLLVVLCCHRYNQFGHRSLCEELSSPGHRSTLENPYVIEVKASGDNVYVPDTIEECKDLTSECDNDRDTDTTSSLASTTESAATIVPNKHKNKLKEFMTKRKKPSKPGRKSKEEICLEVQTFMFDTDEKAKSSIAQGHKVENTHEHEYGD